MHGGEHRPVYRRRVDALESEPIQPLELCLDRLDPSRLFRVPARVVR